MTIPQIKLIQEALKARGLYSGEIDGIFGVKTQAAYAAYIDGPPHDETASYVVDSRSLESIMTLHPRVRDTAIEFIKRLNSKPIGELVFRITSGMRTAEEQNELYEQGRSKPGKIVTNARAWQSNHNYGLAWDSTLFRGKEPIYESDLYRYIGVVAGELGLEWGGNWHKSDEPHVEKRPDWAEGLSEPELIAGLRERHDAGKDYFTT